MSVVNDLQGRTKGGGLSSHSVVAAIATPRNFGAKHDRVPQKFTTGGACNLCTQGPQPEIDR